MSGQVFLLGDIREVSYKVEKRGLFVFGFTSGVSSQIERIDSLISEDKNFAIVPDHSHIAFVGRITKQRELPELQAAIYQFVVDEVVMPKEATRKE